jgi:hypothetical protein
LSDFQCVSAIALGQIDRLFEERDDTGSSNVVRFSIKVGLQRRLRFVGHQWLQDGRGLPVQHTREVTIAQRRLLLFTLGCSVLAALGQRAWPT